MDETAEDLQLFGDKGCNYCQAYETRLANFEASVNPDPEIRIKMLKEKLQSKQKNKVYDCIVGVSGGVDSCWVLAKAVEIGLNPLAVHMDNGWNSEIAQNNISNLIRSLDVDLYTYVIDWEEYRELMQSFFEADVIDIELLYDNAAIGVLSMAARKFKIRHILSGMNIATEGVAIPENWKWNKLDALNIRSIHKKHNGSRIQSFPLIGLIDELYNQLVLRIETVNLLNYIDYDLEKAKEHLSKNFKFKPYQYKHYESVFTRFYQGHILPLKFHIDKRKPHLSALIMSKLLTRDEAQKKLNTSTYGDEFQRIVDKRYFLKKMHWSEKDLIDYLSRPERPHNKYYSEAVLYNVLRKLYLFIIRVFKK
jgi:N-acetyl sugar amidotransferase